MGHIFAQKDCNAQQLPLSTALHLGRLADRARARRRAQKLHEAQAQKRAAQMLALRIDRDHADWVAAGSPEHDEGSVA